MATDPELAAAIEGREHWRLDGDTAVYEPPSSAALVRIRPVLQPARRERYHAAIVRDGTAVYAVPVHSAVEGIRCGLSASASPDYRPWYAGGCSGTVPAGRAEHRAGTAGRSRNGSARHVLADR
jgi:hypothetical protein